MFYSRFSICNHQERNRNFFWKLTHTLNCFCDGFIYVQIKYDKYGHAIVCNKKVEKGFTASSFRFDQTRRRIFHARPVNFAYYERIKRNVIQHVSGIRLISCLDEHLRNFQPFGIFSS